MCWFCRKKRRIVAKESAVSGTLLKIPIEESPADSPVKMKLIEEKRILNPSPNNQNSTKFRNIVAQKKTKGGKQYWISVVNQQQNHQIDPVVVTNPTGEVLPNGNEQKPVEDIELPIADRQIEELDPMSPENNNDGKGFQFSRDGPHRPSIVAGGGLDPEEKPGLFRGGSNSLREIAANFEEENNNSSGKVSSDMFKNIPLKPLDGSESKNEGANLSGFSGRPVSKSASPGGERNRSLRKRVIGYRTLEYPDLLTMSHNNTSKDQTDRDDRDASPIDRSASKKANREMSPENLLSNRHLGRPISRSNSGSQRSIILCDTEDFNQVNRGDMSALDFTINHYYPSTADSRNRSYNASIFSNNNNRQKKDRPEYDRSLNHSTRQDREHATKPRRTQKTALSTSLNKLKEEEEEDKEEDEVRQNKDLNTTYIRETKVLGAKKTSNVLGYMVKSKTTKINQYVLLSTIGKGAWGEVFLGVDIESPNKQKYVSNNLTSGSEGN